MNKHLEDREERVEISSHSKILAQGVSLREGQRNLCGLGLRGMHGVEIFFSVVVHKE